MIRIFCLVVRVGSTRMRKRGRERERRTSKDIHCDVSGFGVRNVLSEYGFVTRFDFEVRERGRGSEKDKIFRFKGCLMCFFLITLHQERWHDWKNDQKKMRERKERKITRKKIGEKIVKKVTFIDLKIASQQTFARHFFFCSLTLSYTNFVTFFDCKLFLSSYISNPSTVNFQSTMRPSEIKV